MIILRVMQYAGHEKLFHEMLEALRNYPGACDEVWLPGNYGYPDLAVHQKNGQDLIPIAEKSRALGIRPSLQISNTLGHGTNGADEGPIASFRKMVGPEGKSGNIGFCPSCENFLAYLTETAAAYSVFHPYCVWIDDDLRAEWHYPHSVYGCFCDDCVARFNRLYGYDLTREQIVARMETDPDFREQYQAMEREQLAGVARAVTRGVMRVSPESYMGWEYVSVSAFGGKDYAYIFDALREESGKIPFSRPGHGVYRDHAPREILDKVLNVNYMNEIAPSYVEVRRPEIENCPHMAGGKSLGGTCVEASLELAYGCNGLTFATLQGCNEPTSFHERMWRRFEKHRPYWQKLIDRNNADTGLGGVALAFGEAMHRTVLPDTKERFAWAKIPNAAGRRLVEVGLPLSYDRATCKVRLLHPDMVDFLTDADIRDLLSRAVLTDAMAVEKLIARGYGDLLPLTVEGGYASRGGTFTDHPANRELAGIATGIDSYTEKVYGYRLYAANEGFASLAQFSNGGDAVALIQTGLGGNWAVSGWHLWNPNMPGSRMKHLCYMADALCGGALPAYLQSVEQMAVIPRVRKADGKTVCVTLQNLQIGETDPLNVVIRNPAAERFVLSAPGQDDRILSPIHRGNDYILQLPPVAAWGTVTVFCD